MVSSVKWLRWLVVGSLLLCSKGADPGTNPQGDPEADPEADREPDPEPEPVPDPDPAHFDQVFEIYDPDTAQPGSCDDEQRTLLRLMFPQMQSVIRSGYKEFAEEPEEWSDAFGLACESLFPVSQASLRVTIDLDYDDEMNDLIREYGANVYDALYLGQVPVNAQIYCDASFLHPLKPDDPMPESLAESPGQKVSEFPWPKGVSLDTHYFFFTESGRSPTVVTLSKSRLPAALSPNPSETLSDLCAGLDVFTWTFTPLEAISGDLHPIMILCPGFWEKKDTATTPPASPRPLPVLVKFDERTARTTVLGQLEPLWLNWYHEIFQWILGPKAEQEPLFGFDISPGFEEEPEDAVQSPHLFPTEYQTYTYEQCQIDNLADHFKLQEAVKKNELLLFDDLITPHNIRSHVWLHFLNFLYKQTSESWSTPIGPDFESLPPAALASSDYDDDQKGSQYDQYRDDGNGGWI